MTQTADTRRLDRPVDSRNDHVLGPDDGDITLVEYGSYACPYCRAANEEVAKLRDRFGDRLRYVFRQRPLTGSDLARRAADVAESAADETAFWRSHVDLMTRSATLTDDDVDTVAAEAGAAPAAVRQDASRGAKPAWTPTSPAPRRAAFVLRPFFINGATMVRGTKSPSARRCWARSGIVCIPRPSTSRAGRRRRASCCC
jgi:NhaA family Na+:H+ antiporter